MEQSTYMCPFCLREDEPVIKIALSLHKCPLCKRSFRNSDLLGYEVSKIDFANYWAEQTITSSETPLINDIKTKEDVDSQMDDVVQESTNNLFHEIIMIKIFRKKPQKAESPEETAIKSQVDKIFDIILSRD